MLKSEIWGDGDEKKGDLLVIIFLKNMSIVLFLLKVRTLVWEGGTCNFVILGLLCGKVVFYNM